MTQTRWCRLPFANDDELMTSIRRSNDQPVAQYASESTALFDAPRRDACMQSERNFNGRDRNVKVEAVHKTAASGGDR